MLAILSLLVILTLSLIVTRVGAAALSLTGLSLESARFQARSAFTGVGFTTAEAEAVVNHPVRRRILMMLMLLGNVGIIATVSAFIVSFVNVRGLGNWILSLILLGAGLAVLWVVATSALCDRHLSRWIDQALKRWTNLVVRDYESLLRLSGDYTVVELVVEDGDWLLKRALQDLCLDDEGVLVLGIQRAAGDYIGAPHPQTRVKLGDRLILYGCAPRLDKIDCRSAGSEGDRCHQDGIEEQKRALAENVDAV